MLINFLSQPKAIGRLIAVLLFAGGLVFAGTFGRFVVKTQAKSCCDGGADVAPSDGTVVQPKEVKLLWRWNGCRLPPV